MPSFADLKAKASGMTSTGVEKFQNARDRNTSVPMAKTNWDPYSGTPPPPPPPPRSLVNTRNKPNLAPLPPPPSRTSSVGTPSLSRTGSVASPSPPQLPSRSASSAPPPPPPRGQAANGPPPPPPRSSSASLMQPKPAPALGGPPPISRATRPDLAPQQSPLSRPSQPALRKTHSDEPEIDWTNLTPEDKQVFFAWLDEFFASFTPPTAVNQHSDAVNTGRGAVAIVTEPRSHPPPPLRTTTKPGTWGRPQSQQSEQQAHQPIEDPYSSDIKDDEQPWALSHPPPNQYGSAADDIAHSLNVTPSTTWTDGQPWYNATGGAPASLPPPLRDRTDISYTSSWRSRATSKTTHIGVYFSDLSIYWGSVEFKTNNPTDPQTTKRSAALLPRPAALGRDELVDAHETYGETLALFAESFLGSGEYCARGECWDLANEGLKYFAQYDYVPKPVPSISRTHGHLIWEGKVDSAAQGRGKGRWRGGDDRIRRGDIIEWRRAKVGVKGARKGSFYTLGDPDHTAIIVSDSVPSGSPTNGGSLKPSEMGTITVVEQSIGSPPEKREYDLSLMEQGEVWIYRPISMLVYLGVSELTPEAPKGVSGLKHL